MFIVTKMIEDCRYDIHRLDRPQFFEDMAAAKHYVKENLHCMGLCVGNESLEEDGALVISASTTTRFVCYRIEMLNLNPLKQKKNMQKRIKTLESCIEVLKNGAPLKEYAKALEFTASTNGNK